jgi:predicted ArsR family transcriptional regulator
MAYLAQHNGSSAVEISRSLRVTAANVRHHLSILVADGRVTRLGFRSEKGPGRPVAIYGNTMGSAGNNLGGLVDVLLGKAMEEKNDLEVEHFLGELAQKMLPNKPSGREVNVIRRLAQTVGELSEHGYAARWEAHAAAPRIILENCPFAEVIDKHPELCQMDAALLQQQLGAPVEQTAKLEKNARGTRFCQFILKKF